MPRSMDHSYLGYYTSLKKVEAVIYTGMKRSPKDILSLKRSVTKQYLEICLYCAYLYFLTVKLSFHLEKEKGFRLGERKLQLLLDCLP